MRILHIIAGLSAESGGPSTVCLEMAKWQTILGAPCDILTVEHEGPSFDHQSAEEAGVDIITFKMQGPDKIRYAPDLGNWLKAHGEDYDLFVLHGSYQYPTYCASHFCKTHDIPYIFTPHGSLDPAVRKKHPIRNRLIDKLYHDNVIRGAIAWHFTNIEEKQACERPIWRSFFVEPLGIDVDALVPGSRPNTFRLRHEIPIAAPLILFLSRLTKKKGVDILLKAFQKLAITLPDVHLALCGPVDADIESMIERAKANRETGNRLILAGMVLGEEKRAAFLDADYYVLPTYSENFGIAVFEALAYGTPVITTTGMNVHETLAECQRVKIIEPDAEALFDAMHDATVNHWIPSEDVESTRQWLRDNFSWQHRAENLLKKYKLKMERAQS